MKQTIITILLALVILVGQAITCRHNARMKKGHLYELPFQRLHKPDGASL